MTAPIEAEFRAGVFYTMEALEARLGGAVSVKTFLGNLELDCVGRNRTFKDGVLGDEILVAMRRVAERDKTPPRASDAPQAPIHTTPAAAAPKRKRGRPPKSARGFTPISADEIQLDREGRRE